MSRHTVACPFGSLVLGWDRPLRQFFFQHWRDDEAIESETSYEVMELVLWAERAGATLPAALVGQLVLECLERADTGTIHDWRVAPLPQS